MHNHTPESFSSNAQDYHIGKAPVTAPENMTLPSVSSVIKVTQHFHQLCQPKKCADKNPDNGTAYKIQTFQLNLDGVALPMPVKLEKVQNRSPSKADDPLKALLDQMFALNASKSASSASSDIWKPTPVYASAFNKDNQSPMPLHAKTQVLRSPVDCAVQPRFGVFLPKRQMTSDFNAVLTPRTLPIENVEMVQQKETPSVSVKMNEEKTKTAPRPVEEFCDKRIKKDALWKPLLRSFRCFLRTQLHMVLDVNKLFDSKGEISEKTFQACQDYLVKMEAPEEIKTNLKYSLALVIVIAPCSADKLFQFFKTSQQIKPYLSDLKTNFCTVFRENSVRLRKRFLQDKLVQHLWQRFLESEGSFVRNYLSMLRHQDQMGKAYKVLMGDILSVSHELGFEVLGNVPSLPSKDDALH